MGTSIEVYYHKQQKKVFYILNYCFISYLLKEFGNFKVIWGTLVFKPGIKY